MKRLLSLLLSLLLVCSIAYPNALASQMIDTSDAGTLRLYSAGDTILAQGDRLYRWDASAQELTALTLPEDARLSLLASDGAVFYGLDAAGALSMLTLTGNEVALTPLAQLDLADAEQTAPRQARHRGDPEGARYAAARSAANDAGACVSVCAVCEKRPVVSGGLFHCGFLAGSDDGDLL